MSITYAMKRGGGVSIKDAYIATERRVLNDDLRQHVRARLREKIIARLAEETGLPFDRAITNIERWQETETTHREWETFSLPHDEQPVLLMTECYVRGVEYPEEAT